MDTQTSASSLAAVAAGAEAQSCRRESGPGPSVTLTVPSPPSAPLNSCGQQSSPSSLQRKSTPFGMPNDVLQPPALLRTSSPSNRQSPLATTVHASSLPASSSVLLSSSSLPSQQPGSLLANNLKPRNVDIIAAEIRSSAGEPPSASYQPSSVLFDVEPSAAAGLTSPMTDESSRHVFNFFNGKRHYAVYKILVRYGAKQWTIFKRYSEFSDLDKDLRKQYPYLQKCMSRLPPKKFFGDNLDPQFVQERARGLHQYVQSLFKSPALLKLQPVKDFLCSDGSSRRLSDLTDRASCSDADLTHSGQQSPRPPSPRRKPDVVFSTPLPSARQSGNMMPQKSAMKTQSDFQKTLKRVGWRRTIFEIKPFGSENMTPPVSANNSPERQASDETTMQNNIQISIDDFHLLKLIGKGNFGKVMLAQHKESNGVYAIKVIAKSSVKKKPQSTKPTAKGGSARDIDHIMAERNVLIRSTNNPFLIGLRWAFQSKEKLYFVTDYVNGGELFFHLQKEHRFSELRARFYAAEIVSALEYLHVECDVVYRDLKPENILLDADGHIKLTDFGLAKENFHQGSNGKTQTFCGTPEYLSPEVIRKEPYGFPVDWWCLGSVLYEMLIGLPPFFCKNTKEMYDKILHEKLKFPPYVGIRARSVISGLLHRSPYFRLGTGANNTSNPTNVKNHPFFEGIDWNKLYRKEYAPPFVPVVSHMYDLRNIDPQFVNEPIPQSVINDGLQCAQLEVQVSEIDTMKHTFGTTFKGFTFVGENQLEQALAAEPSP